MFTVTHKQSRNELLKCAKAQLVPLFVSSPGIGKSQMVHQFAKDYGLKLIDIRLSSHTAEDLQGYPMRNGLKATFTPFDIFPLEGEPIPDGYNGWLLFLDELTSAPKSVQVAGYKLILDRMVGSYKLHPNVICAAAGNKATDKAVVNQLSTALQSRLIHYELEVNVNDWQEHAIQVGIDHRIRGFISYMPSRLMDFRPDHQDKTFACPRTWEFLSRLIQDEEVSNKISARIAGTVGQGTAVEFITFAQEYDRLPKLADIVDNPKGVPVPPEPSTKYATMSMLVEHFTEDNLEEVLQYVARFDIEFQIIFSRGAVTRQPKLAARHEKFAEYTAKMVRYLG